MTRSWSFVWLVVGACYTAQDPAAPPSAGSDSGVRDIGPPPLDGLLPAPCTPMGFEAAMVSTGAPAIDFGIGSLWTGDALIVQPGGTNELATLALDGAVTTLDQLGDNWSHPRLSADGTQAFAMNTDGMLHHLALQVKWMDAGSEPNPTFIPEALTAANHAFAAQLGGELTEVAEVNGPSFVRLADSSDLTKPSDGELVSANMTADGLGVLYTIDQGANPLDDGVYFLARDAVDHPWPEVPQPPKGQVSPLTLYFASMSPDCKTISGVLAGHITTVRVGSDR